MFKSNLGSCALGVSPPLLGPPGYFKTRDTSGFREPAHAGNSASRAATPVGHGEYSHWEQRPPYAEGNAASYGHSAWARLRTPSPDCLYRGIDRGYARRQQPLMQDQGMALVWSNTVASLLAPTCQQPQRMPVQHIQLEGAVGASQTDDSSPLNGIGLAVPPPPMMLGSMSPLHDDGVALRLGDDEGEEDGNNDEHDMAELGESSQGSRGHPHFCCGPCKYNRKRRGCRDGANCDRCHLCRWRPSVDRLLRRRAKAQARVAEDCAGVSTDSPPRR